MDSLCFGQFPKYKEHFYWSACKSHRVHDHEQDGDLVRFAYPELITDV